MNWDFEGPEPISEHTVIEEIRVHSGKAYVLAGAYATRYDWYVIDLDQLGGGNQVLIARAGAIGAKHRGCYPFRKNLPSGEYHVGYIMEKFPNLAEKEGVELSMNTFPFLTSIFDIDPRDFPHSVKSWRPE